jgi:hypothetical protein
MARTRRAMDEAAGQCAGHRDADGGGECNGTP